MAINYKDFGNKLRNTEERSRARLVEESIKPTPEREKFFQSQVFQIGRSVLIEDVLHEILDKRSNYVVVVNESGEMARKFPIDLIPTKQKIQFSEGTFKGVDIPAGFEIVVEQSDIKDPVGMIKMFDCFRMKSFATIFESADKIGIDLESLFEATKADQLQAISIVSGAVGIKLISTDPQKKVDELIKKASMKPMTPDQKKIYGDMVDMLQKLGLKTDNAVKESVQKYMKDPKRDKEEHTLVGSTLHPDDTARKMRVRKLMGD